MHKAEKPKLFNTFIKNKKILNEFLEIFPRGSYYSAKGEDLNYIQNKLDEVPELKTRESKAIKKEAGFFGGFGIQDNTGEKLFIKKDTEKLPETMLASTILYNMGMGPKVDFLPTENGYFIISKDLSFSRNQNPEHRKFHEATTEMPIKNTKLNAKILNIARILKIDDVNPTHNASMIEKDNKTSKVKIFDFLPNQENMKMRQEFNGYTSQITKNEFMEHVKLDKNGNFMGSNQRAHCNPANKASFEKVVEVSFQDTLKKLKEYGKNDEIKDIKTYKNEIIERSKKVIDKMTADLQKTSVVKRS